MVDNAPSEGSLRAALNTTPTPTPTPHPTITTIRSSCSTSSASTSSAGADKNDNNNSNGINENVVEPLRCGICQEYVTNNVGCNACGKLYCQECLNLWFKTKRGSAKCPNCAQSSKFSHVIVAQRMADAILEPCPNECGASIPRGDLELHKAIHCPKTEETCPYCDLRDLREKIEVHEKECLNRPQNPEGEGRRKGKDVLMHHRRNGGGRIFFPHDDGAGAGAGAGAGGARGGGRFRRILESTKAVFIATLLLTAFFTVLVAFMFFHYHREQQERRLTIKRVLDCGLVSLVAPIVMASPTVRSEMGGEVFVPQRGSILIDASYSIINLNNNNGNGNNGNYQNHTVRYRQKITRKHEQETNEEKQLRRTKRILEGRFKIGDPVDIRSKFSDHLLNTYVSSFFFKPPGGVGFGWWYPATVLDVVESSPSTTSNKNKGTRIRVHYTGYPFKDDEWLDLNSPADRSRIAPAYTHVPKTTATGTTTTTTAASARQHHHYSDSGEYEVFAWAIVNNDNNNNKKEGSSPPEDFQWHISKIRVTLHPSSAPKMGTTTSHQSPQGSSSRPSSSFLSSLASSAGMVIASEYGGGGSRSGSGEVKEIEIKVDDRLRIVDELVVEKQQHHHPYHYYHHTYSNSDKKNMEENKQQQQQQRHHLRPYFRRFDIDFDDGNYDEDEDAGMGMGGGGFYDGDFELWMTDPNFALGSLLREMSGVVELPKAVHIALSIIVWLVLFWCGYTVWCLI